MFIEILILVLRSLCVVNGQMICPYCNPNYVDIPGLEEACRGYDAPMGNPNPGSGEYDPGIRKQIFAPMSRDKDGHYVVDGSFISGNSQIKCDGDFSSRVYDKYDAYIKGLMSSSTTGFGVELGRSIGAKKAGNVTSVSFGIPPLFSRSGLNTDDVNNIQDFFKKEKGSISVTEAVCLTHRVDIADSVPKVLLQGFIESVQRLELMNEETQEKREEEFKTFIDDFGTHYQTTSKLGTRIIMERRYTESERKSVNTEDMKLCSEKSGAKVFGLQMESDKGNCSNGNLMSHYINSTKVDRMKVSTFGSFLAESLAEWTEQIVTLVQDGQFTGRVIQRELSLISNLFDKQNFVNTTRQDGSSMNFTKLREWFDPMLSNEYCRIFNISCTVEGCGINDKCSLEEWCIYIKDSKMSTANLDLSHVKEEFICTSRNRTVVLSNGNHYRGSTDMLDLPNGWGTEFKEEDTTDVLYQGNWLEGKKEGSGTLYKSQARTPYYAGLMLSDTMSGEGVLYYASGNEMFVGRMENNLIQRGRLYTDSALAKIISTVDENTMRDVVNRFRTTEISEFLPHD